ncbi:hypothetical protein C0J52_20067 [Blattella germanica]|nr:hypothetical protein C0J52_20067 [Blattella germanica]
MDTNFISHVFIMSKKSDLNINDEELFDEVKCVKSYVTEDKLKQWEETNTPVDRKWVELFENLKNKNMSHGNLQKIIEFCFSLPGSKAATKRVVSIMNDLWDTNKTQMKVETLKGLLITKCNYGMTCVEFNE